ncbi:1-acyl-sn-glycerol-3-phosphate acyltransferase [Pseudooceanicola nitratireducens]|jgi:1-acyl-sn-glycerol-3-phosphate acyltransferase|uniref:1-acyl-sn-glycerol-3-phosphate acyltransferase n=1 Tax=Pseudooceanicola nitratireducens TaxID=517719 RepID=A0A1I1IN60_9RHOB|nr:lysophospholipid acyltransferase family protein [Pseudooceanicola nitratireducens]SEJ24718.1 1-acyl-sn-glycerol-3-phosphate acyltransferase [Pseudooceanicola nitratireducens]SFC37371.1 1-acyl-sn-glycerol-3-phosphate acyltransferase [Pseudooceanicola nitratireducens]
MIQYIRSVVFIIQMYAAMAIMAVYYTPLAIFRRDAAYDAVRTYCRYVRWSARWLVGLRSEVRGEIPTGEVIIASKHQSFFDIILIVSEVPRPKFIMKASLVYAPILGWFALRIGCVPVNRGKRAEAIRQMMRGVTAGDAPAGQLIIYPQGTRVAPGVDKPYKVGTAVIYEETGQICVPAATNVGVFWPRQGLLRKPGLAVVEFLPPIPPGRDRNAFMEDLEREIETASDALMRDAGFPLT